MSKNNLDQLIEKNLIESLPNGGDIDVSKETMDRIKTYEIKREKIKYFSVWVLSLFSAAVCLVSLVIFENIFNHFRIYFLLNHLNPLTLKLIFQGFFAFVLLGLLSLMIYILGSKDQLFYIPEA